MQPYQDPDFRDLPTDDLTCIDQMVSRYESDRRRGTDCPMEAFVAECPQRLQPILQRELLRVEAEILMDWGDTVSLQRLVERWPGCSRLIRDHRPSEDAPDANASDSTLKELSGATRPDAPNLSIPSTASNFAEPFSHRFIIRSELAEGGHGQLYVAHDLELDRDVAIKVLKRRFLNRPELMSRFHAEATVTSHLEHPNIIPVYARGNRPCGQPYFAMRLIKGQSLKALITESYRSPTHNKALHNNLHNDSHHDSPHDSQSSSSQTEPPGIEQGCLDFRGNPVARDLLLRLITVCRAVAYAHARGFVHRDLKPSNIMVGPFGETVIIDWGLAVALADADRATGGTAGYMSPEQSKGLHQANQPSADIYSLGCILYCILTNRQPESTSLTSMVSATEGQAVGIVSSILNASQDQTGVPAELDAICKKATAKLADRRYTSADAMANDLEAWLADEPTSVVAESRYQRLRRRMRSNPGATGAMLGSVAATIAALILLLGMMTRGNALLKTANVRERQQTQLATQAMQTAQEHAAKSEQARGRLMELLRTFLVDVEQELSKVPGSSSVRRQVLATSLNQLSQVVEQFDDDAASAENQALANMSIGDLFLRFGKQDLRLDIQFGKTQLQNPTEAAAFFFDQAKQIVDNGLSQGQTSDALLSQRLELLKCQAIRRGSEVALMRGDVEAASRLAEESLVLSEKLKSIRGEAAQGEQSSGLLNWWAAVDVCARAWKVTGKVERSKNLVESAVVELAEEYRKAPRNEAVQRALAMAHVHLGDMAFGLRDLPLAASHYTSDIELARAAYAQHPDQMACRRDLAVSLDRLGNLQQRQGEVEKAIETYGASQALRQSLYEEDKLDQNVVRELYVSHMKLGDAHMLIKHVDPATDQYESASRLAEQMVAFDGNNIVARRYQSMCAEVMADVSIAREKFEDALRYANESLDASLAILALQPTNIESSRDVMLGHLKVAKVHQAMGDWQPTIDRVKLAMEIADQAKVDSGSTTDSIFVRMKLAEVLLLAEKPGDASQLCQAVIPQIEALVQKSPQDSVWRRRHYQAYKMLAEAESSLEQLDRARTAFQTGIELAEAMIADGQRVETVQVDVATLKKQLDELK